jgi:hypothetical protein
MKIERSIIEDGRVQLDLIFPTRESFGRSIRTAYAEDIIDTLERDKYVFFHSSHPYTCDDGTTYKFSFPCIYLPKELLQIGEELGEFQAWAFESFTFKTTLRFIRPLFTCGQN